MYFWIYEIKLYLFIYLLRGYSNFAMKLSIFLLAENSSDRALWKLFSYCFTVLVLKHLCKKGVNVWCFGQIKTLPSMWEQFPRILLLWRTDTGGQPVTVTQRCQNVGLLLRGTWSLVGWKIAESYRLGSSHLSFRDEMRITACNVIQYSVFCITD